MNNIWLRFRPSHNWHFVCVTREVGVFNGLYPRSHTKTKIWSFKFGLLFICTFFQFQSRIHLVNFCSWDRILQLPMTCQVDCDKEFEVVSTEYHCSGLYAFGHYRARKFKCMQFHYIFLKASILHSDYCNQAKWSSIMTIFLKASILHSDCCNQAKWSSIMTIICWPNKHSLSLSLPLWTLLCYKASNVHEN